MEQSLNEHVAGPVEGSEPDKGLNEHVAGPVEAFEPDSGRKRSRKRSIITFTIISLVNAGLLILLLSQLLTPAQKSNLPGQFSNDTLIKTGDVGSPLLGKAAPDFTLQSLQNNTRLSLSDFKGKPVIINFWQSSCEPCNEEAAFLQQSWQRYQSQGVVFIGIDVLDNKGAALNYLQKYQITYPNVSDTLTGDTMVNYGVTGQPETFFINRDGVVVAKWLAPLDEQGLQGELKKLKL